MNEQRKHQRILAVCQVINEQSQLTGFALDLTVEGIRIIVPKKFTNDPEFTIVVKGHSLENESNITLTVQQRWRQEKDKDFDEIGGLLIKVNPKNEFDKLLAYCEKNAQVYDFDF